MTIAETVVKVHECLKGHKLNLHDEKELQRQLKPLLSLSGSVVIPEYRIDAKNVIDFYIEGVGIEVKIKQASKMSIYRQCKRYLAFDSIRAIILITAKSTGFPGEINGKPCYVINLAQAWL